MDTRMLKELLDYLELFERETGQGDLHAFALWLYQKQQLNGKYAKNDSPNGSLYDGYDGYLTRSISSLAMHAKHYIKTALKDTPLVSIMDFFFLQYLVEYGSQRKTDLISKNLAELSPGMEVIRRLLRYELIEDFPDPDDGRSKRVKVTEKGRNIYKVANAQIDQANQIVMGNLSRAEKATLIPIFRKLLAFHDPIWNDDHGAALETILRKYLPNPGEAESREDAVGKGMQYEV